MSGKDILAEILRDSKYKLSIFSKKEVEALRKKIFTKKLRGRKTAFVTCIIRDKDIQLKPEEIVRKKLFYE